MEPASTIIKKLGGTGAVARATGAHLTRVSNWKRPREKGGTDGRIPQGHIPRLIEYAKEVGVPLSPADFFLPSNSPVSSGSEVPLALCRAAGQPSLGVSSPDCPAPVSAVSGALSGWPVGSFAIGHIPSFVDEQEKTTDETQGVAILAQGRA